MKGKTLLCMSLLLLAACSGKKEQGGLRPSGEKVIAEAEQKGCVLKGETVPVDTVLFRYAYRIRVQGDKAVVLDLHNADYYYHVFTYPGFDYVSSFGKRGEGPEESLYASDVRFAGTDKVWVLDDGKGRMYRYGGMDRGACPSMEKDVLIDKGLLKALNFDFDGDSTVVIPDYSGENRFGSVNLATGNLLRKWGQIPVSDPKTLEESAPAVAQGWRSFIATSPDRTKLVAVTQFGDRMDIYDMKSEQLVTVQGEDGDPEFSVTPEGYGIPTGRMAYYDVQATDKYIYSLYDGRTWKEIMKSPETYRQGGRILSVYTYDGEQVASYVLDRYATGIYVDEGTKTLFATDVNADEQIVKWNLADETAGR